MGQGDMYFVCEEDESGTFNRFTSYDEAKSNGEARAKHNPGKRYHVLASREVFSVPEEKIEVGDVVSARCRLFKGEFYCEVLKIADPARSASYVRLGKCEGLCCCDSRTLDKLTLIRKGPKKIVVEGVVFHSDGLRMPKSVNACSFGPLGQIYSMTLKESQ